MISKSAVSNSPSRHIFWVVTSLEVIIENFSSTACQLTWFNAIKAHVEFLTVFRMGKMWMSDNLSICVILCLISWTWESIFKFFFGFFATLTISCGWPYTSSWIFIEMKTRGTFVFNIFAINTLIESITDSWVWMGEETILSWAVFVCSSWWL